jgi:ATP-dependent 26S proteasome regulatory subunit
MKDKIANYLKAGYSGLYLISYEEARVQSELLAAITSINQPKYQLHVWTVTKGIASLEDNKWSFNDGTEDPFSALDCFDKLDGEGRGHVLLMQDFHLFVADSNPNLIRRIKESLFDGKRHSRCLIVLGCQFKLAPELEKEFTVVEFKLPDKEQLGVVLGNIARSASIKVGEHADRIVDAACGLTTIEAENAFSLSIVERKGVVPEVVYREKASTLKKGGILEIIESKIDRAAIGGLGVLMPWLERRKSAFSPEAVKYGVPTPKGVLIIGISGCGKSLVAKAVSNIFDRPLLKLDAGSLFASHVGESEQNLRKVIQTAEAIAPCVLWIDEIEKGFAGSKSSGSTDGGTSARVFGTFLQWMQEKTSPVFVVATANDITSLPPEFQRKGRFDEMWFVDLPDKQERMDIWGIQVRKYGRKIKNFDTSKLADATENWTGSEIEALFVESLYNAFDDNSEPTTQMLVDLTKTVVPLSKTMGAQVDALRDWAKGKARRASAVAAVEQPTNIRKINV